VVGKFLMNNRLPIPYERIPKPLIQAFIAAEDADFFKHSGIDFQGITRAILKNMVFRKNCSGGKHDHTAGNQDLFSHSQRSLLRKLKEAAYAIGLERNLTKEEILSLYLNNIYLGNGAYGVEAAAERLFQ